MSLLDGKCATPKDNRPGITTYFCVYEKGHDGNHSWDDKPDVRADKLLGRR